VPFFGHGHKRAQLIKFHATPLIKHVQKNRLLRASRFLKPWFRHCDWTLCRARC
jgi:hypothetical protein